MDRLGQHETQQRQAGGARRRRGRRAEDALLARVRRELHDSTARFRLAWEHSPIGMAMVSLDGEWLDVNDALCGLLGRPRQDLLGRVVERITHPEDLDGSLEQMEALISRGQGSYTLDKRFLHADGTPVEVQLTVSAIPDVNGDPDYVLGQIVDMTEIRRAEERLQRTVADLERSNRTLQAFAEVVSHDLTSPLGTSQALVNTVLRHHGSQLSDQAALLLRRADRQAQRALTSARTLLQLAATGPGEHDPVPVQLDAVLDEVVDGFELDLHEVGGRIEIGTVCEVLADPAHLQLVLQNLLANALKYRSPDRELVVRLHCEQTPEETRIHVDDNGRGLPEVDDPERLFELGSRGDDGDGVLGLGLGLATCARIAALHGGRMWVRPRTPAGTRATLELPRR
ncbi:MAG: sensor histidine kinase [Nitriliruptoraceae bacterium]